MSKLRENKGEFSIKGAVMLLIASILLVFFISVMGTVSCASKLHNISDQLARYISIRGVVDSSVTEEQERLIENSGLSCTVTISADYIGGTKKIQFGDSFTVSVENATKFGVGGIVSVPITLRSKADGRSEVYWKY